MKKLYTLLLLLPTIALGQIKINEVDADTPGGDTAEFIELYSSSPNTDLTGYIIVFYNGSDDKSTGTPVDLAGYSTDSNGFFVIGNSGVTGASITINSNTIQNGADAVALYQDNASNFPNDTALTTTNLIDAVVYDTNDSDDSGLLTGLNESTQWNEDMNSDKDNQSLQLISDGSYFAMIPTPNAQNTEPSAITYNSVSTISSLRAGTVGEYYQLTGEVVVTYARSSRNQKYIQDATGAILIDDNSGKITTSYVSGDGMTGLKGKLSEYNDLFQFIPGEDPGAPSSSGNTIAPQTVTISNLISDHETYESEIVKIENVTISEANGTETFSSNTNYTITDGTNSMTLRTAFFEASYIGEIIKTNPVTFNAFVSEFRGTPQVVPMSDNTTLDISNFEAADFYAYPSPVENNLNFSGLTSFVQASVFDMLGKLHIQTEVTNTLDVSILKSGLYMVEIKNEKSYRVFKMLKK